MAGLLAPDIQVFRCPNCKEFVNTSVQECQYCGASISAGAAQTAAKEQARINQVCSESSYAKILAEAYAVSFLLQLAPIIGTPAAWGNRLLIFLTPIIIARTWRKASGIKVEDKDLVRAKRSLKNALAIWAGCFALWLGLIAISLHSVPK
jgi:hypothetical protein